jgi:hypothetical protein
LEHSPEDLKCGTYLFYDPEIIKWQNEKKKKPMTCGDGG